MVSKSRIIGFGACVPERILTNADLENMVDTNDEWITQRTGIHERHILADDAYASDLAIGAVQDLIDRHGVRLDDVDQVIVATFTPDHFAPTVAGLVQGHFDIPCAGSFDLNAGCTGFAYALSVADGLVTAGVNKKILLVAAEAASKVVDYTDRATCILFGDAAVACVVERVEGEGAFLARYFDTDGAQGHYVCCPNHSMNVQGHPLQTRSIFEQNGQQVYKYVMQHVPGGIDRLMKAAGITWDQIDWFVPHSANMRIVQALGSRLEVTDEATLTSIENYGNTSSASIPLALWLAQNRGEVKPGDVALLYGFGAGLTHGGVVVRL